jgi:putative oxidoreductase
MTRKSSFIPFRYLSVSTSMGPVTENTLQRLFSTFAEGWPGAGLLLQRVLTSAVLFYFGGMHLVESTTLTPSLPHIIAAIAGVLLLFGLWTPLAGTVIAIVEVWIFLARLGNPLIAIMLGSLAATVAMIGPGVWSIDAQLYGRKRIEPSRQ